MSWLMFNPIWLTLFRNDPENLIDFRKLEKNRLSETRNKMSGHLNPESTFHSPENAEIMSSKSQRLRMTKQGISSGGLIKPDYTRPMWI
jgi:hypothetical protein